MIDIVANWIHLFYKVNMDKGKKSEFIGIRVPYELKKIIQKEADKDDRSLAWMTLEFVKEGMKKRGLYKEKKK